MVNITIDGQKLQVPEGVTILEAARTANINIPTLCYHEDQKIKSVCRICAVEVEGQRLLQAACSYPVAEGMVIRTSTPTVLNARKNNLELLLAHHPQDCLVCGKNGRCELQKLTQDLNMNKPLRYEVETRGFPIDNSSPCITRDPNKCILCTRCVEACNEVQTVGTFSKQNRGYETVVVTPYDKKTVDTPCVGCGQCVQVCPVGALTIHDDTDRIYKELINGKILVAQVAPSVRVTIAEALGEDPGTISPGRLVTAMKQLGFHQVFDSDFSADLTIMEEGYELLDRIKNGGTLPMITSCCPGWVKFCETFSPKELDHLSSAKSPQQMFGAVIKTYYAEKAGVDPKDICSISIMPCTAKKFECLRPEFHDSGYQDVDISLTVVELANMIKAA
ncbi:MAG: [Fe-Fe] hydrogenase large subunit C-terminal domain-containing protein, partial [Oscillospiraceae bacterium]|nr:[Fe-Fe] hydrogenase large subunit C-terminal domain-containing protein [Oscillospiraceae bacterium]